MMRKKIYVYSINPINFFYCLILSLKYQIVYANYEHINYKLLFLFKDLNNLVTLNHIKRNEIGAKLFEDVKNIKKKIKKENFILNNKLKINFVNSYCSHTFIFYHELSIWHEKIKLIEKKKNFFILNSYYLKIVQDILGKDIFAKINYFSKYNICFDYLWIKFLKTLVLFKISRYLFFPKKKFIKKNKFEFVLTDILEKDISKNKLKKNFSFLFDKKDIGKTLFFFENDIPKAKKDFLKHKINFVNLKNFGSLFNFNEKKKIFFYYFNIFSSPPKYFSFNYFHINILREIPKYLLVNKVNAKYVIGNNNFIPANSIFLDMMKSSKVKSLIINCSSSGILPYRTKHNINKSGRLYQSVICSDIYVTWSKIDKLVVKKRNLNILKNYKIFSSGPIMFGNSDFTKNSPTILYKKYFKKINGKKIIGIFDLDVKENNNRTRISKKFQEKFYFDIVKLINEFPNVQFVFKPKKNVNKFYNSESFKYFLKMNVPNLKILSSDFDPFLSISIIHHCIGMPFTSPVEACNSFKRNSIFYDPLREYSNMYPNYVKNKMIYDYKKLVQHVNSWIKQKKQRNFNIKNESFDLKKFL